MKDSEPRCAFRCAGALRKRHGKNALLSFSAGKRYEWGKNLLRFPAHLLCYACGNSEGGKAVQPKKNKQSKAYGVAFIAAGAALVIFTLVFKLYRWQHYLIAAGVVLLVGRIAFIMAQGVDTGKKAPAQQPIPKTGDAAVDSLVQKGQELLAQIRAENDLIPDPKLSAQMEKLDDIANRIFRTVAEQPGKAPQIRRFMDYYLPTTLKMLTGYRKMDERQVAGANAEATRAQIRKAMEVVLQAFSKQLDTLYQDDMLDISTDIDVLETMLRQDGLVDSGIRGQQEE